MSDPHEADFSGVDGRIRLGSVTPEPVGHLGPPPAMVVIHGRVLTPAEVVQYRRDRAATEGLDGIIERDLNEGATIDPSRGRRRPPPEDAA